MNEKKFNRSSGPLMQAARKFKKLNQAEVCAFMGCSQSALSKMEHDRLIPSAPQWFHFARMTGIAPESLETGYINRNLKILINDPTISLGYKIPKRYRFNRSLKTREIYPFIKYLYHFEGRKMVDDFFQYMGLGEDFFRDFDNLINFQCFIDTIDFFLLHSISFPEQISKIVDLGQDELYWGTFLPEWKGTSDSLKLVMLYSEAQVYFQQDFDIKVETTDHKYILSYFPEYRVKDIVSKNMQSVVNFLNTYRMLTMERLVYLCTGEHPNLHKMATTSTTLWGVKFELSTQMKKAA